MTALNQYSAGLGGWFDICWTVNTIDDPRHPLSVRVRTPDGSEAPVDRVYSAVEARELYARLAQSLTPRSTEAELDTLLARVYPAN